MSKIEKILSPKDFAKAVSKLSDESFLEILKDMEKYLEIEKVKKFSEIDTPEKKIAFYKAYVLTEVDGDEKLMHKVFQKYNLNLKDAVEEKGSDNDNEVSEKPKKINSVKKASKKKREEMLFDGKKTNLFWSKNASSRAVFDAMLRSRSATAAEHVVVLKSILKERGIESSNAESRFFRIVAEIRKLHKQGKTPVNVVRDGDKYSIVYEE